jgi:hypothetical protein
MNDNLISSFKTLLNSSLINCVIYPENNNTYVLFEKYVLTKQKDNVVVFRYGDEKTFLFNRVKNATAWAILDKHNKFYEAGRILELDHKLESINVDRMIHSKMRKGTLEEYMIYTTKHDQDILRQNTFQRELDKYITMAKICQERGFQNELNRSSRKQKEQVGI